jgi:hypothetical protein
MEIESTVRFGLCPVAVNDRCSDDVGVIRVSAADSDSIAFEVYITIASASICARSNFNDIAIVGVVDCGLDVAEICWAIVIYINGSSRNC